MLSTITAVRIVLEIMSLIRKAVCGFIMEYVPLCHFLAICGEHELNGAIFTAVSTYDHALHENGLD
jgi:hypothetical protein